MIDENTSRATGSDAVPEMRRAPRDEEEINSRSNNDSNPPMDVRSLMRGVHGQVHYCIGCMVQCGKRHSRFLTQRILH